ncbi:hypothetical protein Hanom_Chr15g01382251 [Helianthus anomalus]
MMFVFEPVLHEDRYYCACFNLRDNKIEVLDNSASDVTFKGKYNRWPKNGTLLFYKL